jgi:hypothetical protein
MTLEQIYLQYFPAKHLEISSYHFETVKLSFAVSSDSFALSFRTIDPAIFCS